MWAQSDKSAVYTSNVTLSTTGGTSASTAKVKISSTDYDAIKAGASKTAGVMKITVPSGTKYLHLHAVAWNGETVSLSLSPNGNLSASYLSLTADAGVSGSSTTYTLSNASKATTDYYKVLTFSTALTKNTDITFTATGGKRFVIWGVNSEEESVSKSPIGSFSDIDDQVIPYDDMIAFDPADYFTKAVGATGDVSFTVTPTSGDLYYEDGYLVAEDYGSQEFTITATPAVADAASFEEVTKTFTATCTDTRTAVGSITAISPSTVYVGATGEFTLTESMTGKVASYAWSSNDDSKLELADEMYEAKAAGDVNVTVTATPSNATTYKPVTAVLAVTVAYKYSAPTISKSSGDGNAFSTTTNVTLGTVSGATVYYTTDGTTPTSSSSVYSSPFAISATTTINAIAIDGDGLVSPVSTATYTKEAAVKANIALAAGQTLSFTDFSGAGAYADNKSFDVIASDGDKYTWTGKQFMTGSNSTLQMKSGVGVFTSGTITSPNGFSMLLKFTNDKTPSSVKAGETTLSGTSTGTNELTYAVSSTSTAITINAHSSNAMYIKEITLTANKASNTIIATTARTIDRTKSESSVTMDATSTSGSVTYAVKSSTLENEDYSFNASTGVLTVTGTQSGTIVITASSAATSSYYAADDVDITVTVVGSKVDPTIVVEDVENAYGSTYTLDISGFASGDVSLSSSNTAVATVAGLVITPVAVGTTTITVTTAEAALYNAGSDTFEFTVTAPAGGTTAAKGVATSTATLDFTDNSDWGFPTSKEVDENSYNDGTYTVTLQGSTGNGYSFNESDKYVILGKSGASLTFQAFDKFVTQIDIVGRSNASGKVTQNIYVGDTEVSTATAGATGTNEYAIASAYQAPGNIYTLKVTNDNNTQITSIVLHFTDVASQTVTLNANGYATFCSANPIDFSKAEGYTAWYPSAITSEGVITFSKVTTAIKGGQGVLLHGDAGMEGEEVTLYSAGSETVLAGNKFVGTTAPVYFSEVGEAYGLSGKTFVKNSAAGTIGAGKAYIPVVAIPTEVKSFTFVFEDLATGITETRQATREEVEAIFNLAGQRLNKMQKGVNIVNGRKVLVK